MTMRKIMVFAFMCMVLVSVQLVNADPMDLDISLNQKDFACYEPIVLQIKIRNNSAKPVRIIMPVPPASSVRLAMRNARGEALDLLCVQGPRGPITYDTIPAGETREMNLDLLRFFKCTLPGTYDLEVSYGDFSDSEDGEMDVFPDGVVEKRLAVDVRYSSEEELNACHYVMRDSGSGTNMRTYGVMAPMIPLFFKDTVYYKYSYYWLGQMLEESDRRKAIMCYERVLNEYPEFPFADDIRYRQLKMKVKERIIEKGQVGSAFESLLDTTTDFLVRWQIETDLDEYQKKQKR